MRKLLDAIEHVGIGVMAGAAVYFAFEQRGLVVGAIVSAVVAVFLYRRYVK